MEINALKFTYLNEILLFFYKYRKLNGGLNTANGITQPIHCIQCVCIFNGQFGGYQ